MSACNAARVFSLARGTRAVSLLAGLALAIFVVFRVPISNRFTRLWGDRFDGGIEAAILEHWYNVLRGYADWSQTFFFFPHARTLGYNDGYFLYGLIHSLFRAIGFDIFVSSTLVDMVVRACGFFAFFLLARAVFEARFAYALLGAILFTIGHALFMHAFHQQLLSVAFAPLLGYLAVRAWEAMSRNDPDRFLLLGTAAALLYGAWLLTAYYMAWFFGLFSLFLVVFAVPSAGLAATRGALARIFRSRWHVLAVLGVLILAFVPFLLVYLPKAAETGMHRWEAALTFAPRPNDALNVGTGNYLFGRLFGWICPRCSPANYELLMGIPPILMYVFVFAWFWALLSYKGRNAALLRWMALATAATWLLLFRFGDHSLWRLVYDFVPGARGVRVISRYAIFLTFPICVISALYLQSVGDRMPRNMMLLVAVLMIAEQLGTSPGVNDRAEELARIAAPPPPEGCEAFFVTAARGQDASSEVMRLYPHNVEAMLIAELVHLPTINGYSTFVPPGWAFEDPTRADYFDRVRAYADRFGLRSLCVLDLKTLQWAPAMQ